MIRDLQKSKKFEANKISNELILPPHAFSLIPDRQRIRFGMLPTVPSPITPQFTTCMVAATTKAANVGEKEFLLGLSRFFAKETLQNRWGQYSSTICTVVSSVDQCLIGNNENKHFLVANPRKNFWVRPIDRKIFGFVGKGKESDV